MPDTSLPPDDDAPAISPRRLRVRALMLLALMAALLVGGVLYLLYVRGAFEPTQPLFLKCENSEGITTGMDMTFSGFPIGSVRRIRMGRDGQALVRVDIKQTHAHLLRESTIFLLETNVVGAAKLRAVTSQLDDPLLPPGSRRPLLRGDLAAELPRILAEASALMNNLVQLTSGES
ncbi:MAG: MCE family protein, partial [Ottowia sp.]|nr:MCE family protein [Ottowia sp.]